MLLPCFSGNAQQNENDEEEASSTELEPKASSSSPVDSQKQHLDLEEINQNNHQIINKRNKFERRNVESSKWMMPQGISLPFSLKVFILMCGTLFKFGSQNKKYYFKYK
jgi:hypothetical protein